MVTGMLILIHNVSVIYLLLMTAKKEADKSNAEAQIELQLPKIKTFY